MTKEQPAARRIAITGAGSGLGRELALHYARAGWRVAVTDIDRGRVDAVVAEVERAGGGGFGTLVDTRKPADFDALIDRLRESWAGVDVFVNNAGVSGGGAVADTPLDDWHWMLDINLMGMVRGCRAAVPLLRESRGHIVNVASFAAIASAPGMAAYNVAKAGVFSLSESLRAEEHDNGVGVTVACPAFFATNLMESFRSPSPEQKALVEKLMRNAEVTAADVAADIARAVDTGRFLVIPHRQARWQWRLKRLAPERFFRALLRTTRAFMRPTPNQPAGDTDE